MFTERSVLPGWLIFSSSMQLLLGYSRRGKCARVLREDDVGGAADELGT
jgi:hypothetical protein